LVSVLRKLGGKVDFYVPHRLVEGYGLNTQALAKLAARARGLPEWRVLVKYGLAPCSGALLAYLGTQAGALLGGAFVVEMIFSWKGLGSLLVESVLRRDYPLVEAGTFVASAAILAGNWAGDFAQRRMDPRLRESS
ncbi:MAG: ABC transporter permease subunit, partial [Bdellovibrionota bacterium]